MDLFLVSLTVTKRKKKSCHFHGVRGVLGTVLSTCFILNAQQHLEGRCYHNWGSADKEEAASETRQQRAELRSESRRAAGAHAAKT